MVRFVEIRWLAYQDGSGGEDSIDPVRDFIDSGVSKSNIITFGVMTLMGNFQGSLQLYYLYAPQTSQKISLESAISHFSLRVIGQTSQRSTVKGDN